MWAEEVIYYAFTVNKHENYSSLSNLVVVTQGRYYRSVRFSMNCKIFSVKSSKILPKDQLMILTRLKLVNATTKLSGVRGVRGGELGSTRPH